MIRDPDASSPGGKEAGVTDFLDGQLAGAWGAGDHFYRQDPFFSGTPEQPKYVRRHAPHQNTATETFTFRNHGGQRALPMRRWQFAYPGTHLGGVMRAFASRPTEAERRSLAHASVLSVWAHRLRKFVRNFQAIQGGGMHRALDGGGPAVKLLTVNTHKGFTSFNRRFMLSDLRTALLRAAPDIVFLQEVVGAHAGHAERLADWPVLSQYEYLADSVWSDYAYGCNAVYPEGHHGNAVLSRYPIVSYVNHDVSVAGPEPRGLLHCVLQPPDLPVPLHAVCVHMGLRESHRRHQLQRLCELIADHIPPGEPLLVAGDFNDWRLRANHVLENYAMQEVFTRHFGRPARSYPAFWPSLRLDRIYVRGVRGSRPEPQASRIWSRLSDHVPLAAEIAL